MVASIAVLAFTLQTVSFGKPSHIESLLFVSDMPGSCELTTNDSTALSSGSYIVQEVWAIDTEPMNCFVVVVMTGSYYTVLSETVRDLKQQLPGESEVIRLSAIDDDKKTYS